MISCEEGVDTEFKDFIYMCSFFFVIIALDITGCSIWRYHTVTENIARLSIHSCHNWQLYGLSRY